MSPDDREIMRKIFEDVDDSSIEQEDDFLQVLDKNQYNFAIDLLMTFQERLAERFQQDYNVFLAPPFNFSFMAN